MKKKKHIDSTSFFSRIFKDILEFSAETAELSLFISNIVKFR